MNWGICEKEQCEEPATMELGFEDEEGNRTTEHYCDKHGKEVFRPLFWAEYGIDYHKEVKKILADKKTGDESSVDL